MTAMVMRKTKAKSKMKETTSGFLFRGLANGVALQFVMGGAAKMARTLSRECSIALQLHLRKWGGEDGAHMRQALAIVYGPHGYEAYRRYYREPRQFDYSIPGCSYVAFVAWRHATSPATRKGGGDSVQLGVHKSTSCSAQARTSACPWTLSAYCIS